MTRTALRDIFLLWLAWVVIVLGFQALADARYQPNRPDYALMWTPAETGRVSQRDKPYLMEPFMNRQVSWDSEFYLSIAIGGYEDPVVRVVETSGGEVSLNYAFFPLYPTLMSVVAAPLGLLPGLNAIGAAALAGVIVSVLGTLGGLIALYDLLREDLGEDAAFRAGFYLLIFPTGFFLAQVYTEGLFIGLSLGCLAFVRRGNLLAAAVLAALATWTRALGGVLLIPIALAWLGMVIPEEGRTPRTIATGIVAGLLPLIAFGIWWLAQGERFELVEDEWFGRSLLGLERFIGGMFHAVDVILDGGNSQSRVYYLIEFTGLGLAVAACIATLKRYPGIALYGLVGLFISVTSGAPQSLIRYVLVIPSIYIVLAYLGQNRVFDRVWTTASLLVMGMLATLFTFDMWVA